MIWANPAKPPSIPPPILMSVQKFSRQWYVQVPESGHVYVADLGLRWPDGKFVSLFRSNVIRQPVGPRFRTSRQPMDVRGTAMATEQQAWEDDGADCHRRGEFQGTVPETSTMMSLRWEFLRSVFSGSVSSWRPEEPKR